MSPAWLVMGVRTPRSAPSSSSASAPSNGTSARCSGNSASPRAGSSEKLCRCDADSRAPLSGAEGAETYMPEPSRRDHRRRPLAGRDPTEAHGQVTPLELLYDQHDPFHLLLIAGTAGVLVLSVVFAGLGMSMAWCLVVLTPACRWSVTRRWVIGTSSRPCSRIDYPRRVPATFSPAQRPRRTRALTQVAAGPCLEWSGAAPQGARQLQRDSWR